jgi:hypothetical protein
MRRMDEAEARAWLTDTVHNAVCATVRPDGRPHATPVWYTVDGDDFVFTTWHTTAKARNLRASGEVMLVVQDERPPYDYAVVEGRAQLLDDLPDCRRIAFLLGAKYMGEDQADAFATRNGVEGELVVRIRPTKVYGYRAIAE